MAIEKELETLHSNLKALGSAREKLDFAASNVSAVVESIVKAGDSMKRLAEMPELTERIQTSVERMINSSKDVEILNAVYGIKNEVAEIKSELGQSAAKIKEHANSVEQLIYATRNDVVFRLEALKKVSLLAVGMLGVSLVGIVVLLLKLM